MAILDSDLLIPFLRNPRKRNSRKLLERKQKAREIIRDLHGKLAEHEKLKMTIFNQAELYTGAFRSQNPTQSLQDIKEFLNEFEILEFTAQDAKRFGGIKAQLLEAGTISGDMDILIAAIVALLQPSSEG
jgi:predicted nucleic acid-binding protein